VFAMLLIITCQTVTTVNLCALDITKAFNRMNHDGTVHKIDESLYSCVSPESFRILVQYLFYMCNLEQCSLLYV